VIEHVSDRQAIQFSHYNEEREDLQKRSSR
jgi:hypothetical protein